jgi:transcriptional regulator with XRE-family HTH domain
MHEQVKKYIKARGLTQRAVANAAGIKESTLSNYLHGRNDLSAENFVKLVKALGGKSTWSNEDFFEYVVSTGWWCFG